jgi:hypothetical protein
MINPKDPITSSNNRPIANDETATNFNATPYADAKDRTLKNTAEKIISLDLSKSLQETSTIVEGKEINPTAFSSPIDEPARVSAIDPPQALGLAPFSNYREMKFSSGDNEITVAGMGHPKNNAPSSIGQVLEDLKTRGFTVMISLDHQKREEIKTNWVDESHSVRPTFVKDFQAMTFAQSLKIINIVKEAALTNKNVVIHCGEGWGRTGSALATIHLFKLLMQEKEAFTLENKEQPSDQEIELFRFPYKGNTTSLVKKAVMETRLFQKNDMSKKDKSVETDEQINVLEQVEKYFRENPDKI